ncbi:MAG: SurA N-terminal domain-containing protein [bacterium]|nr:SurA N-terminal domain-containing protein [bacterium]
MQQHMENLTNNNPQQPVQGPLQQEPRPMQPMQPMQPAQPPRPTEPPQQGGGGGGKWLTWSIIAVLVLALLVGGGWYAYTNGMIPGMSSADSTPVARVNGEAVSQKDYEETLAQIQAVQGAQPGTETTDEQKQQALQAVVSRALVLQKAEEEGMVATAEEVEQQLQEIRARFESSAAFEAALREGNVTQAAFRVNVEEDLTIQKYLDAHVDVSAIAVSDAEVETAYGEIVAVQEGVPPLQEVRAEVETALLQQKQQQAVDQFLQQLLADADVEILI